jgi:transaldolase
MSIQKLKIKIFADGADLNSMLEMSQKPFIKGLTTNPTLMRKAGIQDYKKFALEVLENIKDKPISFEVFSDDFNEMRVQALEIASWADNVYVKIPVTNTKSESSAELIHDLSNQGVKINATALMTLDQVKTISNALNQNIPNYISIFAGRIADTGRDPVPIMTEAVAMLAKNHLTELIWASPRELLNVFQANEIGCHIITATSDILNKLKLVDYNLEKYSLDTVKMFYEDAKAASYKV